MGDISIFLVPALIYILLIFSGWGVAFWLLPLALRPYRFWLAPWIGISVLSTASLWASRLGIGTEKSVYVILGFLLLPIFFALVFLRKYRSKKPLLAVKKIDHGLMAIATMVSLFLTLSPMLLSDHLLTTTSIGNNDPRDYALLGDYLKTHGIYQIPAGYDIYPSTQVISDYLQPGVRPGTWLLYSAVGSALDLPTHQIFSALIAIIHSLTPPLLYIFTYVASSSRLASSFALLISTLNINLLQITYQGFGAQVPATGILIFAVLLTFLVLQQASENKVNRLDYWKCTFFLGMSISCLFAMYVELVPFFFIPFFLSLLGFSLKKRTDFHYVSTGLTACLATILFDPLSPLEGLLRFRVASGLQVGWPINWALPAEMLGFLNLHTSHSALSTASLFTSILVSIVILIGAAKVKHKIVLRSFLTFSIAVLAYMGLVRSYEYGYYKAATFTLFVFIALFSVGLKEIIYFLAQKILAQKISAKRYKIGNQKTVSDRTYKGERIIAIIAAVCIALPTFEYTCWIYKRTFQNHLLVSKDLSNLREITQVVDSDQEIHLHGLSLWEEVWAAKFLDNRRVRFSTPSAYSADRFVSKKISADSLLLSIYKHPMIRSANAENGSIAGTDRHVLWSNGTYFLLQALNFSFNEKISIEIAKNWHSPEMFWGEGSNANSEFRWLDQDAILAIKKESFSVDSIDLSIDFVPIRPTDTTVSIYAQDKLLKTSKLSGTVQYDVSVPLSKDLTLLRFHTIEGTIKPENETREIAVGISAIRVDVH